MKVGTDGVLLGAWLALQNPTTILDIGTGTGVIALMLAQRTGKDTRIDAVELEQQAYEQATENVKQSSWSDKVRLQLGAIQDFNPPHRYEVIVSNPPYFQNSQKPPDERRLQTRHTDTLSFEELLEAVRRLLTTHGKFNVILPNNEGLAFVDLALKHKLYCSRQWSFRTRKEKPVERWLLEFSPEPLTKTVGEVILYKTGEIWSDEYRNLTKDFYLRA